MTSSTRRTGHRGVTTGLALVAAAALASGVAAAAAIHQHDKVGQKVANGIVLPTNQTVSPLGHRVLIKNGRLLSSTLSPDGSHVAALTFHDFVSFLSVFDVKKQQLVQQVGTGSTSSDPIIGDGTVAADGPYYSPDGKTLWMPQTSDLLEFRVRGNGTVSPTPKVISLADSTRPFLPSGATFNASGSIMYVALNNANTVGVIDTATGKLTRQLKVGVAPRQVALVDGTLFVSDEGGRPATADDVTNLTSGTKVVSNPSTGAVNNGTVSAIDLASGRVSTIRVGLEPTALYHRGHALFVANSNDDSVSIIDTVHKKLEQTFNVNPLPGSTVGSYPNAITMPDASHIFVSIGRDNALAVYHYNGSPRSPVQYEGLIPTDWYPVNVQRIPGTSKMIVTNDKGIGARGIPATIDKGPDANVVTGPNTYSDTGSLTTFVLPARSDLKQLTHTVFVDNHWDRLLANTPLTAAQAADTPPKVIPTKLGAPSKIKHVFLLVKENRTYDQVLGDIGKGDSDPALTQFGGSVTPNQHALANQFGLFDNFYDEGTLSADGHNWLMQADANDYIEKEFGAFYRSYPAQGGDALAYQRDGFLWNAAEAAGKTVRNFGEYNNFFTADDDLNRPTWAQWYQDALIMEGKASGRLPVPLHKYRTYADIPSLNAITDHSYPKFDTDVPDQYRTDIWLKSFRESQRTGKLADLNMLWVPDDHTAGTSGASPYPTAAVADNDLAVGRIIDKISHSRFWKSSAVFVVEDDSQDGTDHVDGHRSPLYLASPYARRGVIDDTYYTQLNVVKTIEQILGIAPMNQEDRAAVPMTDAFTETPDTAPFSVRPNQIPLTYGLATSPSASIARRDNGSNLDGRRTSDQTPRSVASLPNAVPATGRLAGIEHQWQVWSRHQHFGGAKPDEDLANPAQLNRLDWYSATGWAKPYPGDKSILGPYRVPGWDKPPIELN